MCREQIKAEIEALNEKIWTYQIYIKIFRDKKKTLSEKLKYERKKGHNKLYKGRRKK